MRFIGFDKSEVIVEITIKDGSGGKIENYRCNSKDHQRARQILDMLKTKYNFFPVEQDKDIDWMKKADW